MLTLPEELLLLSLDEQGNTASACATSLPYGLAGAALLDLRLMGKVQLDEGPVTILDPTPTGEPVLDAVLFAVYGHRKPLTLQKWVMQMTGKVPDLRGQALSRLIERGILREEEGRILWIFPSRKYPEVDGRPEASVVDRIRQAAAQFGQTDDRTRALMGLMKTCGLTGEVFDKSQRKAVDGLIEAMMADGDTGDVAKAVKSASDAAMAAIMVAASASASC